MQLYIEGVHDFNEKRDGFNIALPSVHREAQKKAPRAEAIQPVEGGWLAFDTVDEWEFFRRQSRRTHA